MGTPERLVVALLAAGGSQRFGGRDKLIAPLRGMPLIHWAADVGRGIDAAQHIVVTAPGFRAELLPPGYRQVVNEEAGEGMAASLRFAVQQARAADATALLILLGDMPLITNLQLATILATYDASRPVYSIGPDGPAQPPALFPSQLFPALESLTGDRGARDLGRDALTVLVPARNTIDVDTLEELTRCERLLGG